MQQQAYVPVLNCKVINVINMAAYVPEKKKINF